MAKVKKWDEAENEVDQLFKNLVEHENKMNATDRWSRKYEKLSEERKDIKAEYDRKSSRVFFGKAKEDPWWDKTIEEVRKAKENYCRQVPN